MLVLCEHTFMQSHAENADTCPLNLDFFRPLSWSDASLHFLKSPPKHPLITSRFWRGLKMPLLSFFYVNLD